VSSSDVTCCSMSASFYFWCSSTPWLCREPQFRVGGWDGTRACHKYTSRPHADNCEVLHFAGSAIRCFGLLREELAFQCRRSGLCRCMGSSRCRFCAQIAHRLHYFGRFSLPAFHCSSDICASGRTRHTICSRKSSFHPTDFQLIHSDCKSFYAKPQSSWTKQKASRRQGPEDRCWEGAPAFVVTARIGAPPVLASALGCRFDHHELAHRAFVHELQPARDLGE